MMNNILKTYIHVMDVKIKFLIKALIEVLIYIEIIL